MTHARGRMETVDGHVGARRPGGGADLALPVPADIRRVRVRERLALAAVLVAALLLRLWALDSVPAGAQHDEVFDTGFALTIVQGEYPIFFAPNGGVHALFMYMMAPAIALFGRTLAAGRLVAALTGVGGLLLMYLCLRALLRPGAALVATAAAALSFWHLYLSRVALEPISVALFGTAAIWALWEALRSGKLALAAAAGLLLGLTAYTYQSGVLIALTAALFAGYLAVFHWSLFRSRLAALAVAALVSLAVVLPMASYLLEHPDTSTSRVRDLAVHVQAATRGDLTPLANDALAAAGMFGWRGDPEWRYNLSGRPVFEPAGAVLFYTGCLIALRRFRRPEYGLLLIWLSANLLFSAITPPSPSSLRAIGGITAAYAFPAITVMALWDWVIERRWPWGRALMTGAVALWLSWSAGLLIRDYFGTWANHPEVRAVYRADLAEAAHFLDAGDTGETIAISAPYAADLDRQSFEMSAARPHALKWFDGRRALVLPAGSPSGGAALLLPSIGVLPDELANRFLGGLGPFHTGLDPRREPAFVLYRLTAEELAGLRSLFKGQPREENWNDQVGLTGFEMPSRAATGERVRVTLYWRVLSEAHPPDSAAPIWSLHLVDERGELWTQENYQAFYPSQWGRDDRVAAWFDLAIPVDAPPGRYRITAGLTAAGREVPVRGAAGWESGRVTLGEIVLERGPAPAGEVDLHIRFPRRFDFGPIRLLGANALESAQAGGTWLLSLYWQAIARAEGDVTVVVRVHGNNDEVVCEWRTVLLRDAYPTSRWQPGEYLRSNLYVPIPAGLAPSKGRVRVNLYDAGGRALGADPGVSVVGLAVGATAR